MSFETKEFIIKTPKHKLKINCYFGFIDVNKLTIKKEFFLDMCKKGCKNFNNKYCCPPFVPDFKKYIKDNDLLFVVLLRIDLNQLSKYKYAEYHKLRIGNAVIKPRIEKIMRHLEFNFGSKFLSSGACRLCKPCQRKINKPCKHPKEMRHSLESFGIDCNNLSKVLFDLPLLWYQNAKAPEYTSVISALPLKKDINKVEITNLLKNYLN
jgi:predicted metal-binding protein